MKFAPTQPATPQPRPGDRAALARVVADPSSYATTLAHVAYDLWGDEYLGGAPRPLEGPAAERRPPPPPPTGDPWDYETVERQLSDDLDVEAAPATLGRLMTSSLLLTTDWFTRDLDHFIRSCRVLAGATIVPGTWEPAEPEEIAWGVTEGLILDPPEPDDFEPFTDEIRSYIGKVLEREGIARPADVLRLAMGAAATARAAAAAQASWADDPELAAAITRAEDTKTREILNIIHDRLRELARQLAALPLLHGDAAEAARYVTPRADVGRDQLS